VPDLPPSFLDLDQQAASGARTEPIEQSGIEFSPVLFLHESDGGDELLALRIGEPYHVVLARIGPRRAAPKRAAARLCMEAFFWYPPNLIAIAFMNAFPVWSEISTPARTSRAAHSLIN
jgi:hypothetical protein